MNLKLNQTHLSVLFTCSTRGRPSHGAAEQHRWRGRAVPGRQLLHVGWRQPVRAAWRGGDGLQPPCCHSRPEGVCVCAWISSLFSWCSWWCGPAVHMWAWLTCTLWCTSAWIKGSGNWVTASDQMWHFFLHLNSIWIIRPASESLHRICLKPSSRSNYCCWY